MTEPTFLDAESMISNDKDQISFRLIILWHVRKISQLCAVEWNGGYFEKRLSKSGSFVEEIYVQDTRACFWNATTWLYYTTRPYFDEEMKTIGISIHKSIKTLRDENGGPEQKDTKEEYDYKRMMLNWELYSELLSFLKRKDYFKNKIIEE